MVAAQKNGLTSVQNAKHAYSSPGPKQPIKVYTNGEHRDRSLTAWLRSRVIAICEWLLTYWLAIPAIRTLMLSMRYKEAQVLLALTQLGVADALKAGPLTSSELAQAVGADEEKLYRVIRAAVNLRYFKVIQGKSGGPLRFANNHLSAVFAAGHPESVRPLLLKLAHEGWRVWEDVPAFAHAPTPRGPTAGASLLDEEGLVAAWEDDLGPTRAVLAMHALLVSGTEG